MAFLYIRRPRQCSLNCTLENSHPNPKPLLLCWDYSRFNVWALPISPFPICKSEVIFRILIAPKAEAWGKNLKKKGLHSVKTEREKLWSLPGFKWLNFLWSQISCCYSLRPAQPRKIGMLITATPLPFFCSIVACVSQQHRFQTCELRS